MVAVPRGTFRFQVERVNDTGACGSPPLDETLASAVDTLIDPTDLAGQAVAEAEAEAIQLAEQTKVDGDMQWLMANRRGRRVVHLLLSQFPVQEKSFNPNALLMAYSEGEKEFSRWLMEQIERACPERFHEMMTESRG